MTNVIEMKGITKVFPGVVANDNINFELKKGEIHALLGENGAGKTTLMKILYGLYRPTSGEIYVNGKRVDIDSPNKAIELGIGMVHQHFMLIPPFTVAENIVLGSEPAQMGVLDTEEMIRQVEEISDRYGLSVDPRAKVQDISVGMQQRVEILKALYRGADILILDEPTAVLTPQEVQELIAIMDKLTEQGKSIIFITHKLKEVKAISDRVTVIRRGKVIDTVNTEDVDTHELARMMVGREVILEVEKEPAKPGETILKVENLHALNDRGLPALRGVSFEVRAGEILGIAGVEGNGQSELTEVLTGLRPLTEGSIEFRGEEVSRLTTRQRIEAGISYIPEDRHKRGLVLDYSLSDNMILGHHYKKPFAKGINLNYPVIHSNARELIEEFDVRTPNEEALAKNLSGGNQQKVIIARELSRDPDLLIAAQPTRGVDVGAIEFIHKRIVEQRDAGKAVLLISLELDEILSLSDRIAVIYEGQIVDIIDAKDATEEELGLMMAGAGKRKEQ
ncbi:ABC transporter ATP-binding protein [Anoxybacter fermentans]|uniref:ABC transporter ATP-binding protein n=1 Tax=Anoxybacter fermentans TaxID=1323375 RepID=A0A3S9SVX5_9FIRM|nr:ABC transporter ATP-binding protein [Anoxybacter fermentans]